MLRSTATRMLIRSISKAPSSRSSYRTASAILQKSNSLQQLTNNRPKALLSLSRPNTTSLLYATKADPPQPDKSDPKKYLQPHPEEVSVESSVRHVFEHGQGGQAKEEPNVMKSGMRGDLQTIKETFALDDVPREPLYLGLAGVLPYAATSAATYYLAWDINHAADSGSGYLFTPEFAHQLLDIVTPIQIGYGAVIISFLGAIHWGMEYAGYGGHHGYRRYMYGVIAPAIAWPSIYMPLEYALITQFGTFVFLYFADARATVRGWFPPWYSTYRFVLTAFAGAAIVLTLIGHGQIVKHEGHIKSPVDYVKQDRDAQWLALEREEKERRQAIVEADEAAEEDGNEEGKDDEESNAKEKDEGKDENKSKDDKEDGEKDDKKDGKKDDKKTDKK